MHTHTHDHIDAPYISDSAEPLSLVFYDVYDPEDKKLWAGTAAHIIHAMRKAGHRVRVVGKHVPFLRRGFLWVWYHYYLWLEKKYYHPDRDRFWTWVYSMVGSLKLAQLKNVDAVITCSPAFTAHLKTSHPVVILHDATWGQCIENYPHLSPSRQPKRIVDGGFYLDRLAFTKPNAHYVMSSKWAADRAVVDYGAQPKKFSILPFGANFDKDPRIETLEAGMRARGGHKCQLLFVGRDWERKGGPLAVSITEQLRREGVPAELHVIGCSPANLPDFVKAHGPLNKNDPEQAGQLEAMYAGSDFFLMPTRAEAQGIVFNEAAAYGLPVVSTNVGGVSSVVRADWGVLMPIESGPEVYAAWIKKLFNDRERYNSFAQRARQEYTDRLSSSVYAKRLSAIINKIVHSEAA